MVLELRPPQGTDLHASRAAAPTFAAYVMSFVFVGIYCCGIGFAFISPVISDVLFVFVAVIWFVPDRRFESAISNRS